MVKAATRVVAAVEVVAVVGVAVAVIDIRVAIQSML